MSDIVLSICRAASRRRIDLLRAIGVGRGGEPSPKERLEIITYAKAYDPIERECSRCRELGVATRGFTPFGSVERRCMDVFRGDYFESDTICGTRARDEEAIVSAMSNRMLGLFVRSCPPTAQSLSPKGASNGQIRHADDDLNNSIDDAPRSHKRAKEASSPPKRAPRRRRIDPTTCEREYTTEEVEFMRAMDQYKRDNGRPFPTWSEVLEVLRAIGYRRTSPPSEMAGPPASCSAEVRTIWEREEKGDAERGPISHDVLSVRVRTMNVPFCSLPHRGRCVREVDSRFPPTSSSNQHIVPRRPEATGGDRRRPEATGGDRRRPEATGADRSRPEPTGADRSRRSLVLTLVGNQCVAGALE